MNYKKVDDLSPSVPIICTLKVCLVNMLSGSIQKNRKIKNANTTYSTH